MSAIMKKFSIIHTPVFSFYSKELYRDVGLNFKNALLRLAIAAVTPCIIAGTILDITGIYVPWLLYPLVALGYLFYGVKATSSEPPGQEEILRPENTGI